jgi:hypothetical protein
LSTNSWAEFAGLFRTTRDAFLDHERAKNEPKALMPEDAKEAIGHGLRAKRSKAGPVSFDVLEAELSNAPLVKRFLVEAPTAPTRPEYRCTQR